MVVGGDRKKSAARLSLSQKMAERVGSTTTTRGVTTSRDPELPHASLKKKEPDDGPKVKLSGIGGCLFFYI